LRPTDELMEEHRLIERMLKVVSAAADRLDKGEEVDQEVFVDAADFFRNFADKCHHGKEESLLFEKMMEHGVSGEVGPIAVMLREHQDGRVHVMRIAELSGKELDEKSAHELVLQTRGYVDLLGQHIQKEDNVLYPMANALLTSEDQEELGRGFGKVERELMGPAAHDRYARIVERWEKKYG
jgi:hemerythrin-like domain-containing protein